MNFEGKEGFHESQVVVHNLTSTPLLGLDFHCKHCSIGASLHRLERNGLRATVQEVASQNWLHASDFKFSAATHVCCQSGRW